MAFYMNLYGLNEGEQAEEYLKRKQDIMDKNKDYMHDRYGIRPRGHHFGSRVDIGPNGAIASRYKHTPGYDDANNMKNLRKEFPDVAPKSLTKSEKKLQKVDDDISKEVKYSHNIVDSYNASHDNKELYGIDNQIAKDAARRHYRRHVKEMGIFSECHFLDEDKE